MTHLPLSMACEQAAIALGIHSALQTATVAQIVFQPARMVSPRPITEVRGAILLGYCDLLVKGCNSTQRASQLAPRGNSGLPLQRLSAADYAVARSLTGRPFSFIRPCNSPAWNISRM